MCAPLLTATAAFLGSAKGMAMMGALGSLMSVGQGLAQASSQNKYAEEVARRANQAALVDYEALKVRQIEIDQQTALKQMERTRQAMRERARIRVAAGEAGVSGNTPMRELANAMFQEGYDNMIHEANQESQFLQVRRELQAVRSGAASRANQASPSQYNFLGVLSDGLSGFSKGWGLASNIGGLKIRKGP